MPEGLRANTAASGTYENVPSLPDNNPTINQYTPPSAVDNATDILPRSNTNRLSRHESSKPLSAQD